MKPRATAVFWALWCFLAVFSELRSEDQIQPLAKLPQHIPSPKDNPTTAEKVTLGKQLFFDPRLSGDNKMSCATCHLPEKAFGDGLPQSRGADGKTLARNSQTLLNVGLYGHFLWDGRATSLEQQALMPIQSAEEMIQDLDVLEVELGAIEGYVAQFQAVFGSKPNREDIAKALAAFQRTIVTKPAPFDRYLAGDKQAISAEAKRGLELFTGDAGCIRCHNGPLLSDGKFHRLGVSNLDKGRGKVTGKAADNYKFRTPSLRNIAETGPYMHDGSLETLDDVVFFYFRGVSTNGPDGLPLDVEPLNDLSFSDIASMVAFLKSLTGEQPDISKPQLP